MSNDEHPENLPVLRAGTTVGERENFAARLRPLFVALGISYRVYGKQRHLTPSAVCRYLKGDRIPPLDFLIDLFEDLADKGHPVDEGDRSELLRLREQALRGGGAVQQLQAQLEETREELADCRQEQLRLVQQLAAREETLGLVEDRLHSLRQERDRDTRLTEHIRTEQERDALHRQVQELREELLREQAWALRAKELCRLLLWQLRLADEPAPREATVHELMSTMDRATVGQLVGFVAQADDKHRPVAAELIRSAGRHRPISDAVALFVALHDAGTPEQAIDALPAAVLGRGVDEVSDLIGAFDDRALDEYTATVVRTAVRHQSWQDLARLVAHLHGRGLSPELGDTVAAAAAAFRPVGEVRALLVELGTGQRFDRTVDHCLDHAARERTIADLISLAVDLADADRAAYVRQLTAGVLGRRRAPDAAEFLGQLARVGLSLFADEAYDELIRTGAPALLVGVLAALDFKTGRHRLEATRQYAATARPVPDVIEIVQQFEAQDMVVHAADLTVAFVQHRPAAEIAELGSALDRRGSLMRLLSRAVESLPVTQYQPLIHRLDEAGLPDVGIGLLAWATRNRLTSDALEILTALPAFPGATASVLDSAADRSAPSVAQLVLALRERDRPELADTLLRTAERRAQLGPTALRNAIETEEIRQGVNRTTAPGRIPSPAASRPGRTVRDVPDVPTLLAENARLRRELDVTRQQLTATRTRLEVETARRERAETLTRIPGSPYDNTLAPLGG
ncbi:hypothetical protein [Kitasatospora sp. P5_F3]